MICKPCGNGVHNKCESKTRDKTWCDCQHKTEGKWVKENPNVKP